MLEKQHETRRQSVHEEEEGAGIDGEAEKKQPPRVDLIFLIKHYKLHGAEPFLHLRP